MIFLTRTRGRLDGALSRAPANCQLIEPLPPSGEGLRPLPSSQVKAQSRLWETSRNHGTPQSEFQPLGSLQGCSPPLLILLPRPL